MVEQVVLKMMKNVERGCELQYVVFRFGNELRVRGGKSEWMMRNTVNVVGKRWDG